MTLIKDYDYALVIDFVGIILLAVPLLRNGCIEFLNGSDDDTAVRIFELSFQNRSRGIAVGGTLFKTVILTHRLIVKVFTVNDKQHLVDIFEL